MRQTQLGNNKAVPSGVRKGQLNRARHVGAARLGLETGSGGDGAKGLGGEKISPSVEL